MSSAWVLILTRYHDYSQQLGLTVCCAIHSARLHYVYSALPFSSSRCPRSVCPRRTSIGFSVSDASWTTSADLRNIRGQFAGNCSPCGPAVVRCHSGVDVVAHRSTPEPTVTRPPSRPRAAGRQGLVNVWTTIDWDWSPSASSPVADTLTYDFIYVKRDRALSRVRQHWWRHWWRNRTVRRGRERDDATDKLGIRFTLRGKSHHVTNREPNATTINDFASAIRLGQLYAMKQDAKMSQRCRATLHVI